MGSLALLFLLVVDPDQLLYLPLLLALQLLHPLVSLPLVFNDLLVPPRLEDEDIVALLVLQVVHHCLNVALPQLLILL